MGQLKVVSIGGFGHSVFVFDDMMTMDQAKLMALAPAFEGEDISFFKSHPLCKDVETFDKYDQMLSEIKPDVAVVSTRLDLIPEIIINAANAGCHIIAEKPLALDAKTLMKVHKAVKENNVKLTAMLSMRGEPYIIAAREVYKSGAIGEAVLINGRKSYKYGKKAQWFGEKDKYGGTIGWVGIHALDFINYITDLEFTKVAAMKGNFTHPELPACEDNCALTLALTNGGHATVSLDYCRPQSAKTHGDEWIRIVGTKGVLEARGSTKTCEVLVNGEEPEPVKVGEKGKIFKDFLTALANDELDNIYQRESFMLTHACLCAQQSAEQGTFVDIEKIF